ncbi:MAG: ACP S-malonyltransferase [Candidatus Hydrogenedentes bacterium]|nr:ACP S-malonyltransferase [Candidatus Hydrogenedentota bacterium]
MPAFLFPGQGSQQAGAAALFQDTCPESHALFDIAQNILSNELYHLIMEGTQEALHDTRVAQPALVCVEVAVAAYLQHLGVEPAACAGHSLGEISALVAAGAIDFADALVFVVERARLMSTDVPEGGMTAVLGLAPADIEALLPDDVQVANYNGSFQTIISGTGDALKEAARRLKEGGAKRLLPLSVSGPFHSKFMKPAADQLAAFLKAFPILPPKRPFLSSVSGEWETDPEAIRSLLAAQLYRPVQWTRVMEQLGKRSAVEAGPGTVLQGLAKRTPDGPVVCGGAAPEQCRNFAAREGG